MKLIHCDMCGDVVTLRLHPRACECKRSGGMYLPDRLHAVIWGFATPLGFANRSFRDALEDQPEKDWGKDFTAFVIQKQCDTVKVFDVRPSYVCLRCGKDEKEAADNGCDRGPCPMEIVRW